MSKVAEAAYGDVPFKELEPDLFSAPADDAPEGVPADLAALFEQIALELIGKHRMKHYSARAILHRIRWFHHVERGDADWKCNNNHTAKMARWFIKKHPQHAEFFKTRERTR